MFPTTTGENQRPWIKNSMANQIVICLNPFIKQVPREERNFERKRFILNDTHERIIDMLIF